MASSTGVAFNELAAFEAGPGADERDEVGCVDGAPAFLGGVDQLECHGDPGVLGAGPLGDLGPVPDCGEGQPIWGWSCAGRSTLRARSRRPLFGIMQVIFVKWIMMLR